MSYDQYAIYKPNFGVGSRVRVIRQRNYPEYKLLDLVGTVRTDTGSNVSVIFDSVTNVRSQYGCFYFKPNDLVIVEENNMEENTMSKIINYINVAKIHVIDGGYETNVYCANFESDLAENDFCVISLPHKGIRIGKVLEIVDHVDMDIHKEVVCKIDTRDYDKRVERREKAEELKAKMEERAKQLQDIALYQMLAKDDAAMQALLTEYQGLI